MATDDEITAMIGSEWFTGSWATRANESNGIEQVLAATSYEFSGAGASFDCKSESFGVSTRPGS